MTHPLALLAAFVLGVLATARLTRLVVHDSWPPIQTLRFRWVQWAHRSDRRRPWSDLLTCPYCFAPYAAALVLAVAIAADVWSPDLGTLRGWWLVLAVWAAGSYLASIVVVYDEPDLVDHG